MRVSDWLLLATLALAWYHVGIVWLVQVNVWPLFARVGQNEFEAFHLAWWRGLRYVLFVPSGLTLLGVILLLRFPPDGVQPWLLWSALGLYLLTYILTAAWWGPQQAKLTSTDTPRFGLILRTHWVRTALVSGYGALLLLALVMRLNR